MGGDLALLGAAAAFGIGSAVLPMFLNAELYVGAMGALVDREMLFWVILSLGVGTVAGKALVFELVRAGSERFRRPPEARRPPRNRVSAWLRDVGDRLLGLLDRPYLGALTVFVSSLLAVPPLAVVTVLAPLSRQPLWLFLLMVFLGRTLQFLALGFLVERLVWIDR